jgi:hypothetical protein
MASGSPGDGSHKKSAPFSFRDKVDSLRRCAVFEVDWMQSAQSHGSERALQNKNNDEPSISLSNKASNPLAKKSPFDSEALSEGQLLQDDSTSLRNDGKPNDIQVGATPGPVKGNMRILTPDSKPAVSRRHDEI